MTVWKCTCVFICLQKKVFCINCKALQAMSIYLFFHYIRSVVYNVWQIIFNKVFFKFMFSSGSMYIFRFPSVININIGSNVPV